MHKIFDIPEEDEAKLVFRIETFVERAFPELFANLDKNSAEKTQAGRRTSFGGEEKTVITEAAALAPKEPARPVEHRQPQKKSPPPPAPRPWPMANLIFVVIAILILAMIWLIIR